MYFHFLFFLILAFGNYSQISAQEPQTKKKHELSICAIFKNEGPWLKEWIEFHKIQGVTHFYLYNNNSTDNFLEVLKPYIMSKEVTLTNWDYTYQIGHSSNWITIQKEAYSHCLKHFGPNTQWLAIIDTDEFLFCPSGKKLTTFLTSYKQYGGLSVNWIFFGTSHVKEIPPNKLMIEMLTLCKKFGHTRTFNTKSVVQPEHVVRSHNAHVCVFQKDYFSVEANFSRMRKGIRSRKAHFNEIRINHYWTRTEKFFLENKVQSRSDRRTYENTANLTRRANSYNQAADHAIEIFIPELRLKMGLTQ